MPCQKCRQGEAAKQPFDTIVGETIDLRNGDAIEDQDNEDSSDHVQNKMA